MDSYVSLKQKSEEQEKKQLPHISWNLWFYLLTKRSLFNPSTFYYWNIKPGKRSMMHCVLVVSILPNLGNLGNLGSFFCFLLKKHK